MTDSQPPAAPAVKTYSEDDVAALMKEKLAAEAKAASLIDKVNDLVKLNSEFIAANESIRGQFTKAEARVALLQKELDMVKDKYIEKKKTDW